MTRSAAKKSDAEAYRIDHITVAGRDLDRLRFAFRSAGFGSHYGGAHSNGITHMAVCSFADGSYLELISSLAPDLHDHAFWPRHIAMDAGPCAWAIEVDDVASWSEQLRARGIRVDGPHSMSRMRPDGVIVEWDLAFPGDAMYPGTMLPFLIRDRTPREFRVQDVTQSGSDVEHGVSSSGVRGVGRVVIGAADTDCSKSLFDAAFGDIEWNVEFDDTFGAELHHATAMPITLARPRPSRDSDRWLLDRLNRFGVCPCAFMLHTDRFDADCHAHGAIVQLARMAGSRAALISPSRLDGSRIGLIEGGSALAGARVLT